MSDDMRNATQGALALYLNEVQPVDGRVQINVSIDELTVLRHLASATPAVGGEYTQDDLAGRRKRLSETVILIGKALDAGRSLASIFPLEDDALQSAKDVVAKRLALLNTACYEFKTTFHHDLAAAPPASPLRGRECGAAIEECAKLVEAECERMLAQQYPPSKDGMQFTDTINTNIRMMACNLPNIAEAIRALSASPPEQPGPITTEQLDKLQFGRTLHKRTEQSSAYPSTEADEEHADLLRRLDAVPKEEKE